MAYYNTCAGCGATLDPGEKCDCTQPILDVLWHSKRFSKRYIKRSVAV